jgi:competence protein ComEC
VSAANDASLVVRLTHAGRSILFTGDIQSDALKQLLQDPERLGADVLLAAHHGSSEEETAAFVRAVNPSIVLSSNDRTLTMKQRNFERMVGAARLYRTNTCGALTVRIDGGGNVSVQPFLFPAAERDEEFSVATLPAQTSAYKDGPAAVSYRSVTTSRAAL